MANDLVLLASSFAKAPNSVGLLDALLNTVAAVDNDTTTSITLDDEATHMFLCDSQPMSDGLVVRFIEKCRAMWPRIALDKRIIESIGSAIRHAELFVPYQDLRAFLLLVHNRLADKANEGVNSEAGAPLDTEEVCPVLQEILADLALIRIPGGSKDSVGSFGQWSGIFNAVIEQLKVIVERARLHREAVDKEIAGGGGYVGRSVAEILATSANRSDVDSAAMCHRALAHYMWKSHVASNEGAERNILRMLEILEKLKRAMDAASST